MAFKSIMAVHGLIEVILQWHIELQFRGYFFAFLTKVFWGVTHNDGYFQVVETETTQFYKFQVFGSNFGILSYMGNQTIMALINVYS